MYSISATLIFEVPENQLIDRESKEIKLVYSGIKKFSFIDDVQEHLSREMTRIYKYTFSEFARSGLLTENSKKSSLFAEVYENDVNVNHRKDQWEAYVSNGPIGLGKFKHVDIFLHKISLEHFGE